MTALRDPAAAGSHVRLEIDAEHHMIRVARLVASGLAAIAGFDIDAVEDLRIAVDEGCVWLMDEGDGTPLVLTFQVEADGAVAVTGRTGRGTGEGELSSLVGQIMAAACADHTFAAGADAVSFHLTSRPPAPRGGASGEGRRG